jgi:predicted dehydrogenase
MIRTGAAIIGTGFIGPVHLEGLRRLGVPVCGVMGSSPEKSRLAAERLGVTRCYASLKELLADPSVAAVHITSPNREHFSQTMACLEAGKHVLCEKPLAMNSGESQKLVDAAKRSDRVCAVNYNIRFYPLCLEAQQRVRQNSLGDIYHITGCYVQDWLLHDTDFNWRVLASEGGPLRALADIGTHWLDLAQSVTGLRVTSVCADLQTVHAVRRPVIGSVETFSSGGGSDQPRRSVPIDTEDYGAVMLRFENGACGLFHVSQVTAGRKNFLRLEIAGSENSLAWESETPNSLWIGHRDRANEQLTRDPALVHSQVRPFADYPGGHNEGFPDSHKQLFRAFYSSLPENQMTPLGQYPTFEDGHREIVLCEAILESAKSRKWIDV